VIIAGPRLDPVRWVPWIAPRPFVMVNARDDERLPRSAVDALYASAREPKELIWMSGAHVHGDKETIQRLVAIVMERMKRGDGRRATGDGRRKKSVSSRAVRRGIAILRVEGSLSRDDRDPSLRSG
jgi:fermentation-respiration switch protein FrsA (DUF1100 family)